MTTESTWHYDDQIRSRPSDGVDVIKQFIEQLEQFGWSEKELFGIHMAMEEAIMNAIRHGNECVEDRPVRIEARFSVDDFYLKVSDQGDGFNPDDVPDPTLAENIERTSGRGLMLMRHYMDAVDYNQNGNSVEMRKRRAIT